MHRAMTRPTGERPPTHLRAPQLKGIAMTQTAVPTESAAVRRDGKQPGRHERIRNEIIEYLARNGASKLADISNEVTACRDTVRTHLTALERAAIVRSNIPPGTRARTTPFYSLASQTKAAVIAREAIKVQLTVHIKQASDGQLTLAVDEMPGLLAYASRFSEIPDAVRSVVARRTGKREEDFSIVIRF